MFFFYFIHMEISTLSNTFGRIIIIYSINELQLRFITMHLNDNVLTTMVIHFWEIPTNWKMCLFFMCQFGLEHVSTDPNIRTHCEANFRVECRQGQTRAPNYINFGKHLFNQRNRIEPAI